MRRTIAIVVAVLIVVIAGSVDMGANAAAPLTKFPAAGQVLTRVTVEVTLVLGGDRPAARATCPEIRAQCDEVVLTNGRDTQTGKILPVVFERGEPQIAAATGLRFIPFNLANDPVRGQSRLMSEFGIIRRWLTIEGNDPSTEHQAGFPCRREDSRLLQHRVWWTDRQSRRAAHGGRHSPQRPARSQHVHRIRTVHVSGKGNSEGRSAVDPSGMLPLPRSGALIAEAGAGLFSIPRL